MRPKQDVGGNCGTTKRVARFCTEFAKQHNFHAAGTDLDSAPYDVAGHGEVLGAKSLGLC